MLFFWSALSKDSYLDIILDLTASLDVPQFLLQRQHQKEHRE